MKLISSEHVTLIGDVLKAHLQAAATKDIALLRNVFVPNGVFVGTDDTELWSIEQLADLLDNSKAGWTMNRRWAQIYKMPNGVFNDVATFIEFLAHDRYGAMRGSGLVVRENGQWKIAQYVLSFSVPNRVVDNTNILELLAS